jgi:hypothetical protein
MVFFDTYQIPMDYVVRSEYRNDTASNIALIANDSVERYGKHLTESRGYG